MIKQRRRKIANNNNKKYFGQKDIFRGHTHIETEIYCCQIWSTKPFHTRCCLTHTHTQTHSSRDINLKGSTLVYNRKGIIIIYYFISFFFFKDEKVWTLFTASGGRTIFWGSIVHAANDFSLGPMLYNIITRPPSMVILKRFISCFVV